MLQGTVIEGRRRADKRSVGRTISLKDRVEVLRRRKRCWKQNKMEGEGCKVRGAPTVIDYGIGAGAGLLVRDQHSSIYLLGGLRSLPERRGSWSSKGLSETGSWGICEGSSFVGMSGITGPGTVLECNSSAGWSLLWDSSFRALRRLLRTVLLRVRTTTDLGTSWHFTTSLLCANLVSRHCLLGTAVLMIQLCVFGHSLVSSSPCTSFLLCTTHHNLSV